MVLQQHNFRELLLKGNSRSYTDFVADIVIKRPELVGELWEIYLSAEEPVSRRAAWIIDTASEDKPDWVQPYLPALIGKLPGFLHDGLKRHALRMIARLPFPVGVEGELLKITFDWLLSPAESVAVKMHCMQILYRLSETEPDILQELYDTIEFQMEDATPGFRSIGSKMMQQIDKDIIREKMGGDKKRV
ncbi:MAG: hypothetical protein WCR72_00930 [Bacteroidota bacterium]